MTVSLHTPKGLLLEIAHRARVKRLALNLTQTTVAERSGVSLGVLKKFEHTGKISLESLLKLALVLEALNDFTTLFSPKPLEAYSTLNELLQQKPRMRGRS